MTTQTIDRNRRRGAEWASVPRRSRSRRPACPGKSLQKGACGGQTLLGQSLQSVRDWLQAFLSGAKARIVCQRKESIRSHRTQEDPQRTVEELVREMGAVLAEYSQCLRAQDEFATGNAVDPPVRAATSVPVAVVRVGRRSHPQPAGNEADLCEDAGRVRGKPRPTQTVTMRFVHAGRRPTRISEDSEG